MSYSIGKKKGKWKWRLFLILSLIVLTVFGMFKLFPSTYDAVKGDTLRMVGLEKKNVLEKDSTAVITIKVPDIKPTIEMPNKENELSIPIEINDNTINIIGYVNGNKIKFMLDTGCSDMHMSVAELYYLSRMGGIDINDTKGTAECVYADGSKHDCPIYLIKEISFGEGMTVNNVTCTVDEHLEATPLLGNAVLSKLGKVSVDYKKKLLIIEK